MLDRARVHKALVKRSILSCHTPAGSVHQGFNTADPNLSPGTLSEKEDKGRLPLPLQVSQLCCCHRDSILQMNTCVECVKFSLLTDVNIKKEMLKLFRKMT